MKNEIIPVTINIHPVIIPALCSNECQFNLRIPLYANLTHNTMPATEMNMYRVPMVSTAHQPIVPANRK